MAKTLFVGNLDHNCAENDLHDYFASAGSVVSVNIIQDRATGRSRGFAFVEMATDDDAKKAIDEFHNKEFQGRPLTVNEARPKESRPAGGGGGGGYGGRGGRGGGGGGGGRAAIGAGARPSSVVKSRIFHLVKWPRRLWASGRMCPGNGTLGTQPNRPYQTQKGNTAFKPCSPSLSPSSPS